MALWAAAAAASADRPAEERDVAPATVALTPARTRLLYGTASEIDVSIDVAGPEAASGKPIRALATVGVLEMPRPGGAPGHFTSRYLPPSHRFPEVALLVVELASGPRHVLASARIALEGST